MLLLESCWHGEVKIDEAEQRLPEQTNHLAKQVAGTKHLNRCRQPRCTDPVSSLTDAVGEGATGEEEATVHLQLLERRCEQW